MAKPGLTESTYVHVIVRDIAEVPTHVGCDSDLAPALPLFPQTCGIGVCHYPHPPCPLQPSRCPSLAEEPLHVFIVKSGSGLVLIHSMTLFFAASS